MSDDKCTGISAVHWLFGSSMVGLCVVFLVLLFLTCLAMPGLSHFLCVLLLSPCNTCTVSTYERSYKTVCTGSLQPCLHTYHTFVSLTTSSLHVLTCSGMKKLNIEPSLWQLNLIAGRLIRGRLTPCHATAGAFKSVVSVHL